MKRHLICSLLIAAASAAAPALAQRSVSGTIGGAHAATPAAAVAATQAAPAAPATTTTVKPADAAPTPAADATAPAAPANADGAAPVATTPAVPAAPVPAPSGAMAMTIPTPQPSAPSTGGGLLQTSLALIFVIGLMLGLAWLTKRFGPRNFGGGNRHVKLVGALSVGARERILVVEVGEQWIVVGASPGRMNALATMPRQASGEPELQAPALPSANFADWFKQTIDKRNGK
ncbi:flagellar protein FliO/FliZ [Duganella sp. 1224]|uniref:flagellar biosynthetic protein FliO n=1 Tax=Duganella sp. 1224 TaxID=2587052 RepID=UPI0015CA5562|nr:flagellar biosynthetic protein FliO [Duganella sp. 1224]NYE61365.1 flagellar protein FliO/FliZ [Duganella sp. 1224]